MLRHVTDPAGAPLTEADVRRCRELLEAILSEPGVLAGVPEELRVGLRSAAGRLARPDPVERARLNKGFRSHRRKQVQAQDRGTRAESGIRVARQAEVFAPPPLLEDSAPPPRRLEKPRDCYVCKAAFCEQHFFYDAMCRACGDFNYAKRFQTARLEGRVALVTGARVKIGYQIALKCLRAGARVVATTRFPRDAALRYAREPDYAGWRDHLEIHGLDLRHSPSVEVFARWLAGTLDRLDLLINNACQTVRRPPGFYAHLIDLETQAFDDLPDGIRAVLGPHEACKAAAGGAPRIEPGAAVDAWHGGRSAAGLVASAQLSQVPLPDDGAEHAPELFPRGCFDADLQQVDLRTRNSWRMTLAEVSTPELLEVHLVNAVAPYVLCARLKPLMARDRTGEKHVVNVSAMEGKFSRGTKTDCHPHTNMAKAALNMMTLTSAPDFLQDGIHMNAVDTGWVTDEDPAEHARRKQHELDFQPPLDLVDGAARVCDPFFAGLLTGVHVWGKFLKDYRETEW